MTRHPPAVLVLAPNWLGDAVMSLPAIADVRRHFAAAKLVIAARSAVAELFRLVPGVDDVVSLRWRGRPSLGRERGGDVTRLREVGADVALLMPNSFASALLARQARVAERWGYAADLRSFLLTRAVPRSSTSLHQGAYYQRLTGALGIPPGPLMPRLDVPRDAVDEACKLLERHGWDGVSPLAVLAPGAAYGTAKRWIPAHVSALARALVEQRQMTCVLVGSGADRQTTAMVREAIAGPAREHVIDVAGETSLAVLAGLCVLARVCVSNDSGAMHLAAAIGTPVAAVFGPTREYETSPLPGPEGRTEVIVNKVACRPCMLRECPIDHRCMTGITPERVFVAVDSLMRSGG